VSRYLSLEEVIEINSEMIRRFGGIHGVRDAGALEAAVARPMSGYYQDLFEEAAALFESLSQNHPFADGNKRTAIVATAVFLILNKYELAFNDVEAYDWLMALYRTGKLTKSSIEAWIREHAKPF
jgi:death-on-curing protein